MTEESTEKDETERDLDELYKDGRKPTLKGLADLTKKHNLKLVSIEFPSEKKIPTEKPEE